MFYLWVKRRARCSAPAPFTPKRAQRPSYLTVAAGPPRSPSLPRPRSRPACLNEQVNAVKYNSLDITQAIDYYRKEKILYSKIRARLLVQVEDNQQQLDEASAALCLLSRERQARREVSKGRLREAISNERQKAKQLREVVKQSQRQTRQQRPSKTVEKRVSASILGSANNSKVFRESNAEAITQLNSRKQEYVEKLKEYEQLLAGGTFQQLEDCVQQVQNLMVENKKSGDVLKDITEEVLQLQSQVLQKEREGRRDREGTRRQKQTKFSAEQSSRVRMLEQTLARHKAEHQELKLQAVLFQSLLNQLSEKSSRKGVRVRTDNPFQTDNFLSALEAQLNDLFIYCFRSDKEVVREASLQDRNQHALGKLLEEAQGEDNRILQQQQLMDYAQQKIKLKRWQTQLPRKKHVKTF